MTEYVQLYTMYTGRIQYGIVTLVLVSKQVEASGILSHLPNTEQ